MNRREMVEACIEFKKGRLRPVRLRNLKNFGNRLLRMPGMAEKAVRSLTAADCRAALEQAFAGYAGPAPFRMDQATAARAADMVEDWLLASTDQEEIAYWDAIVTQSRLLHPPS